VFAYCTQNTKSDFETHNLPSPSITYSCFDVQLALALALAQMLVLALILALAPALALALLGGLQFVWDVTAMYDQRPITHTPLDKRKGEWRIQTWIRIPVKGHVPVSAIVFLLRVSRRNCFVVVV
jgi:hypothetical protein